MALLSQTPGLDNWVSIVAGRALVYPKGLFDYIGIALVVVASNMVLRTSAPPRPGN